MQDLRSKEQAERDRVITEALGRFFGYLVWRDTKAALLLFIRDADVSTVTGKALEAITHHRNCKRPGKVNSEERYNFVIHAEGDTNREIYLAFLPFLIGGRNTPDSGRHRPEAPGSDAPRAALNRSGSADV